MQVMQQLSLADAYPDLEGEIFHVMTAHEVFGTGAQMPEITSLASSLVDSSRAGWADENGANLLACIECEQQARMQ